MNGYQLKEHFIMSKYNFFVVKTVSEKPKEGPDKYGDSHVWDIFWQVKKYFKHPFTFTLLTNFTTITHPSIRVVDISKWEYDGWWNKMLLFHPDIDLDGKNIYLDLDVTIQNDISQLGEFIFPKLLTKVYCYWKPIDWLDTSKQEKAVREDPDMRFPSFYNSSVMGWVGHTLHDVWNSFYEDDQYIMTMYRGNDDYLGNDWINILKPLPRGICYSWYYGAECGSEFFPRDKKSYKKRPNYSIRLLNGPKN